MLNRFVNMQALQQMGLLDYILAKTENKENKVRLSFVCFVWEDWTFRFLCNAFSSPPSCYAAPLNKPKDEDDKAKGIPAINVEEIAKEEEILEEGTKGKDERIHVKPQLVMFKRVENAKYYPSIWYLELLRRKLISGLVLGHLRNHWPTTAYAHQRTSHPLIAMPSLHVGENKTQSVLPSARKRPPLSSNKKTIARQQSLNLKESSWWRFNFSLQRSVKNQFSPKKKLSLGLDPSLYSRSILSLLSL